MSTPHPQYAFLHVLENSEVKYESTQPNDLASFWQLVREAPEDFVSVYKFVLHRSHDSVANSGVVKFIQAYAIDTREDMGETVCAM